MAFYGTPAFQNGLFSIGRRLIPVTISQDPKDSEVQAIAAFLRVLNALENIRSSISAADRARTMMAEQDARELAALAQAETIDAIGVLSEGAFAGTHESSILSARGHLLQARQLLELGQGLPTRLAGTMPWNTRPKACDPLEKFWQAQIRFRLRTAIDRPTRKELPTGVVCDAGKPTAFLDSRLPGPHGGVDTASGGRSARRSPPARKHRPHEPQKFETCFVSGNSSSVVVLESPECRSVIRMSGAVAL